MTLAVAADLAHADPYALQGVFDHDDDQAVLTLTLAVPTTLTAQTFSWAGGVSSADQPVASGGFAPVLSLFGADHTLLQLAVGSTGVCGATPAAADPVSGACWDGWLAVPLAAGTYTLVLTQDDNLPLGPTLLDGFSRTGQPSYTGAYVGSTTATFVDVSGRQRSGFWMLDLNGSGLTVSQVPEPAPVVLFLTALLAAPRFLRKN